MTSAELKKKLEASIDFLKGELTQIRTGRVIPAILDGVVVHAYGSEMSVVELGSVNMLDAQTLQIAPWDKSVLEAIASGIRESDLNLNPTVRGEVVIVPVPAPTEERRIEMTKVVTSKVEECKQSLRSIRQDAMKSVDTRFANKEFGEDEKFTLKEEYEEIVKDFVKKAESLGETKKEEVMKVGS